MFATHFTQLYYQVMKKRPRFTSYSLETVVSNSFISSQKAVAELTYRPRSMYETLSDTVAWWLENRHWIKATLRA
jgi:dihydroflavonol-4-reductase